MSMTDPTILQLLEKADCRYIDEVNRGLITYERAPEIDVK